MARARVLTLQGYGPLAALLAALREGGERVGEALERAIRSTQRKQLLQLTTGLSGNDPLTRAVWSIHQALWEASLSPPGESNRLLRQAMVGAIPPTLEKGSGEGRGEGLTKESMVGATRANPPLLDE